MRIDCTKQSSPGPDVAREMVAYRRGGTISREAEDCKNACLFALNGGCSFPGIASVCRFVERIIVNGDTSPTSDRQWTAKHRLLFVLQIYQLSISSFPCLHNFRRSFTRFVKYPICCISTPLMLPGFGRQSLPFDAVRPV